MKEGQIVRSVVATLRRRGFTVATEVPNFHRSADVGAIDNKGNVWVVECKTSSIGRAIEQTKTHKLAADRVFIATHRKRMREATLKKIRAAGIGLLYVMRDGSLSDPVEKPGKNRPWQLARTRLYNRILEGA